MRKMIMTTAFMLSVMGSGLASAETLKETVTTKMGKEIALTQMIVPEGGKDELFNNKSVLNKAQAKEGRTLTNEKKHLVTSSKADAELMDVINDMRIEIMRLQKMVSKQTVEINRLNDTLEMRTAAADINRQIQKPNPMVKPMPDKPRHCWPEKKNCTMKK